MKFENHKLLQTTNYKTHAHIFCHSCRNACNAKHIHTLTHYHETWTKWAHLQVRMRTHAPRVAHLSIIFSQIHFLCSAAVPCSRTFVPDVWFIPVAHPPHSWRLHWLLGQSCHCVHFVVAASFRGNVKLCVILVTMETYIVLSDVTMMLTYSIYSENNNVR